MDDTTLLRQFESRELPFSEWRHAVHIRVAWIYLTRHPFPEALLRIRQGIRAYNAHNRVEETPLAGFHETITEAWARVVADLIARFGAGPDSGSFLNEHPHVAAKTLLRSFYSRERILTPEAKQRFVSADRAPLPEIVAPLHGPVRRASAADLPALLALWPSLARDDRGTARTLRALAAGTVLVSCEGTEAAGMLALDYQFFDRAFVDRLAVRPQSRRRGHGLALVRAAIGLCESAALFTSTNRSNLPMQALLRKLGFSPCGEVDQLDPGDPECFFVLHKEKP